MYRNNRQHASAINEATGHRIDCLCRDCVAYRGGYTPEEYAGWTKALREDSKQSLDRFASNHYANKRSGLASPVIHGEEASDKDYVPKVTPKRTGAPATEKQVSFLSSLLSEREHSLDVDLDTVSKQAASQHIAYLLEQPRKAVPTEVKPQEALPNVPNGYYAIPSEGTNDLTFLTVQHGKDRWAGRVFVKMVVGGHPDMPIRRDQIATYLRKIVEAGIEEAAKAYGQNIGRCGRCNRTLTDEHSRAIGLGPECASKAW